ncbi:MAG TPA: GNAT family N-acetyltransferase [Candidatus Binataceae bacterium]|nr:GNAT family N-acetyltransferase [Candidatus Binataceae bacterium]
MPAAPYRMMNIDTDTGVLTIVRAAITDSDPVMALLREAADWLSARGISQWEHWYMDGGKRLLRERLENHEVYLFERNDAPVGTLTIQWSDPEVWGDRGIDRLAGYVHGIAIARSAGGMRVGERILEWAVGRIAARGLLFARLDAIASNAPLCRYYEQRGFRPLGTALLFGNFTTRLFEREVRPS